MGELITLYKKKRQARSKKWPLPVFTERARRAQEEIENTYLALVSEYKLLKRRKRMDYRQCINMLQMVRDLCQQIDAWSTTMYDDDHLPSLIYTRRFPLLSACYHVQHHANELITLLVQFCASPEIEAYQLDQTQLFKKIVSALANFLESGREVSFEITTLLDQIRFHSQQSSTG